jgi:hypothetical protein
MMPPPINLGAILDLSSAITTSGLSVGNFLSYKVNNSKLSLGLYYRIGLSVVLYEYYYYNYYSATSMAFRKYFGFNIQYGKLITNFGFEWGRTFDTTISGNDKHFYDENIPTGMFDLSIGLIF